MWHYLKKVYFENKSLLGILDTVEIKLLTCDFIGISKLFCNVYR